MAKIKKSDLVKGRKIREFTAKESKSAYKIISKVFLDFEKDFVSGNSEYFAEKKDFVIDYKRFATNLKRALLKAYRGTAIKVTGFTNNLFGWGLELDVIKSVSNKAINRYNKLYSAEKVKNITETTRDIINKIVLKGQKEGLNRDVIAKSIKDRIGLMSKSRSKTIARTETANAVQTTTRITAEEAGVKKKMWLHTDAGKEPRGNHMAVSGKEKKINEKFDLGGGIKADYPHDPNLPAGEIINCFCLVIYR